MSKTLALLICLLVALFAFLAGIGVSGNKGSYQVDIHVDKEHETVCYTYRESITCMPVFNGDEPSE